MTKRFSFTKYENRVLPNFREKINKAESSADLEKFFTYTIQEFFKDVFEGEMQFHYEDIKLVWDRKPHYVLSHRLRTSKDFLSLWNESDLSRVVERLAGTAKRRYIHLEKHPEKTDSKIRM